MYSGLWEADRLPRDHAILFDLDDTLFDHRGCTREALAVFRRRFAALRRVPMRRLEQHYHDVLEELHPRVLAGELDVAEARAERMARIFAMAGSPVTRARARRLAEDWREAYDAAWRPVRGARSLLKLLRESVVIGIVTNNRTDEQRSKLRRCRLDGLVDFLLTSEECGRLKPDPAFFREALRRCACPADRVLVVGDSWSADVAGARSAGLRAVWFNRLGLPAAENGVPQLRSWMPVRDVSAWLLEHVRASATDQRGA